MDRSEILIEADELASIIAGENLRLFDATVLLQSNDDETGYDNYLAVTCRARRFSIMYGCLTATAS